MRLHTLVNTTHFLIHSMEFHGEQLKKCCRVCGKRLLKAKGSKGKSHTFHCLANSEELLNTFGVDVRADDATVHPQHYCLACHCMVRKKREVAAHNTVYRTKPLGEYVFRWEPHQLHCTVSR